MRIAGFRLALVLAFAACGIGGAAADWYGRGHGRPPAGDRVYICHGYTCRIVSPVQLSAAELKRIAAPLSASRDAEGEREALSAAVEAFEAIVGARIGTGADRPGTQLGQAADDQMDCIDEATNTTSLLLLLSTKGLLAHHSVRDPTARGFLLDGRYPHATAVLVEKESGRKWSVDSWPRANGEAPVIMPLSDWFRQRTSMLPS